jgi:hypothetical protein
MSIKPQLIQHIEYNGCNFLYVSNRAGFAIMMRIAVGISQGQIKCAGTKFDPDLVSKFIEVLESIKE